MSTREPASYLISGYPHPLDREVEVPPVLCPKSLPLFAFSIIITRIDFLRRSCTNDYRTTKRQSELCMIKIVV